MSISAWVDRRVPVKQELPRILFLFELLDFSRFQSSQSVKKQVLRVLVMQ